MLTHLVETSSTMFYKPETLPHIVLADRQLDGQGRTGPWLSPKGNFYATFFFDNFDNALITFTATVAHILDLKIVWPNDLMLNGVKCGGILVNHDEITKIGVGVNFVETKPFAHLPVAPDFEELASDIEAKARAMDIDTARKIYRERSNVLALCYKGKHVADVNPACELVLENGETLVHITSAKGLEE